MRLPSCARRSTSIVWRPDSKARCRALFYGVHERVLYILPLEIHHNHSMNPHKKVEARSDFSLHSLHYLPNTPVNVSTIVFLLAMKLFQYQNLGRNKTLMMLPKVRCEVG